MKRDNAFTGLEAAIVLIAFVVVAAIFSYVLLGAGFFATQKAQEVTYAGIKQTTSNAVIDGSLYANTTTAGLLNGFMFNVRIPLGGEAVDMSTTTFLFTSSSNTTPQRINVFDSGFTHKSPVAPPTGTYNLTAYYPRSGVPVLTSGEFATFMLSIQTGEELHAKEWFALEMRPLVGAATLITKTLGSGMSSGEVL